MKNIILFCLCLFPLFTLAASDKPTKVILGLTPSEQLEVLSKNGKILADDLTQKLHVPVEIFIPKDYAGLVAAMEEKKIDFAFFTALAFVEAEEKSKAKVLLKKVWEGPYYFSSLIVSQKSKIKKWQDLKGKKIGFVDEKSMSGYLYPKAMLLKNKMDPDQFFKEKKFFGTHDASVKALVAGEVEAIAVYADDDKAKGGAWTKYAPEFPVRVLWVSEPIPNDPFCVRQDFYEKYPRYTHDLMFSLIDLQDEEKNPLKQLFGVKSFALATSKQYDPVRELSKFINKKKP